MASLPYESPDSDGEPQCWICLGTGVDDEGTVLQGVSEGHDKEKGNGHNEAAVYYYCLL